VASIFDTKVIDRARGLMRCRFFFTSRSPIGKSQIRRRAFGLRREHDIYNENGPQEGRKPDDDWSGYSYGRAITFFGSDPHQFRLRPLLDQARSPADP
jgi:hypothetical protein